MTDAHTITEGLGGRWHGNYGQAYCPSHANTRTPALSLANAADGRLLVHCHAGCEFRDVMNGLRGLGLVEGHGMFGPPDPAEQARRRAEDKALAEKRAAQAQRLWQETLPITDTLAETYLRNRGITCTLSFVLGFHPSCWHATAQRFPALIARIEGADHFAIHRTYLRPDGSGKADIEPSKAMLGPVAGGAVRLSDQPGPLVITEGIETGLSLLSGLLKRPATVWAALSTSGMKSLKLPSKSGRLTIAPDGDAPGRKAAHALAERATALGWQVSLLPAPDGRDWNDVLTMNGGAE